MQFIVTLLLILSGTFVLVNGFFMSSEKLILGAMNTVDQASARQLATAVELYHSDYGEYPTVEGGEALIALLYTNDYIDTVPINPAAFLYAPIENGEDYSLALSNNSGL